MIKQKILSVLIPLCLVITTIFSSSYAETFTLRNGVCFGDTISEVKEKEKLKFFGGTDEKLIYTGEVVGYDGRVIYFFDKKGSLYEMWYTFGGFITEKKEIKNIYDFLKDGLTKKYGKPLGNKNGTTFPVFSIWDSSLELSKFYGKGGGIVDYEEWLVPEDDYCIKIDLTIYDAVYTKTITHYGIECAYHYMSMDEYTDALTKVQQYADEL